MAKAGPRRNSDSAPANVTRRFGSVVANDRIDLAVRPGAIHAIVGGNGAGKIDADAHPAGRRRAG
jgi:ABC-type uncharacterized transport system ATPase subunit